MLKKKVRSIRKTPKTKNLAGSVHLLKKIWNLTEKVDCLDQCPMFWNLKEWKTVCSERPWLEVFQKIIYQVREVAIWDKSSRSHMELRWTFQAIIIIIQDLCPVNSETSIFWFLPGISSQPGKIKRFRQPNVIRLIMNNRLRICTICLEMTWF